MRILARSATLLYLSLFMSAAWAQSIPLQNLDRSEFKKLVGDFSANSQHTSVSGAASLGKVFGIEAGLVAGVTRTPEINRLAHEVDPSAKANSLPHAAILGAISVPGSVTVEVGFVPKVGNEDFKFNSMALAAKWTFSDWMEEMPVDLAFKAQIAKAKLEFDATVSSIPTHFEFENTVSGAFLFVSKDLGLLAPYAALGAVRAGGKMSVMGSGAVFSDPEFQASNSASASQSGTAIVLGTEVQLGVLRLGAEFARAFSTNSFTGKVTLVF